MKMEMRVMALEAVLMGVAGVSCIRFLRSETWVNSVWWWAATLIFLFLFWVLGVHRFARFTLLGLSGIALLYQLYLNITLMHVLVPLAIASITYFLCKYQYYADAVWSVKTIVIDWLVCTSLLVILTCVDAIKGSQYLILAVAYFCSSNIFSVAVMKACEFLMTWRSPIGAPFAKYIHNLSVPITALSSLHLGQLMVVAWTLVALLWRRMEEHGGSATGWQVMAAGGLWGSLYCYICPIIANKNPTPYIPPPPRPTPGKRLQQQS
eukprot:Phypoly_transcript_13123.p1 GENE.Phypoly_transcript_13123~~Phypoly_transcript_13123.p1  ORF type:complete len:265 (+),score=19.69 Phypoly_transcript_13123:173-967(+)